MKKVLVTGANGFIGKNLCVRLEVLGITVLKFTKDSTLSDLDSFTKECGFVFHLAGANRPVNISDFKTVNTDLTESLYRLLHKNNNKCSVVLTSSTQAESNNDYGNSKKLAEEVALSNTHNTTYIYRLPNVFGKWSKPNYNTVIATFCYNISRNIPISISNRENIVNLVYIDDVVSSFISLITSTSANKSTYVNLDNVYKVYPW